MKKALSFFVLAAMIFAAASCKKDENPEETKDYLTYEEQISYLDATGVTLLQQFEPNDFQKLADITEDVLKLRKTGVTFGEATQLLLAQMIGQMTVIQGGVTYMFVNTDLVNGTLTIKDGVGTFAPGTGKHIVLISTENKYSADIEITNSAKAVRVGNMMNQTKLVPQNGDILIYAPSAIDVEVKYNNALYAHGKFNMDYSEMGEDWTALQAKDINFTVSGDLWINGEDSYRVQMEEFTQKASLANVSATLYGRKSDFMASAKGNMAFVQTDSTATYAPIDLNVKILDRVTGIFNGPYSVDVYMDKYAKAQMTLDLANGQVTCIDGTKDSLTNLLTTTNFPLTFMSGGLKLLELMSIFDFIEWPDIM